VHTRAYVRARACAFLYICVACVCSSCSLHESKAVSKTICSQTTQPNSFQSLPTIQTAGVNLRPHTPFELMHRVPNCATSHVVW